VVLLELLHELGKKVVQARFRKNSSTKSKFMAIPTVAVWVRKKLIGINDAIEQPRERDKSARAEEKRELMARASERRR
jgi:hypothetical protein